MLSKKYLDVLMQERKTVRVKQIIAVLKKTHIEIYRMKIDAYICVDERVKSCKIERHAEYILLVLLITYLKERKKARKRKSS